MEKIPRKNEERRTSKKSPVVPVAIGYSIGSKKMLVMLVEMQAVTAEMLKASASELESV